MCSIMGLCGKGVTLSEFYRGFEKTVSRGPDDSRIVQVGDGLLAFHRLAIMGLTPEGMQPFSLGEDRLVCNGEIYGFRSIRKELEKEFSFQSDSDCEILLPMWQKYGTEMFRMLDAEFALILYDSKSGGFVAARDPIGIRPLFYGTSRSGDFLFASEAKNLVGICDKIKPFPPGHYWKDGKFVCYRDISHVDAYVSDNVEQVCRNIRTKLITAVKKRLDADAKIGFLLSGGLDSSLVCAIAANCVNKPIRTFAIGMDKDAIDLHYARKVADFIGSDHTEVIMTEKEVLASLENVIASLGTWDITTIRASMGMYLLCKWIHEHTDLRVLLTGEVSDELFGYKYTDFAPSAEEFQKESEKRVRELYQYDVLRADRCISDHSLEARVPFGDLDFASYVLSVRPELKQNVYGKGKYLLRHAFSNDAILPYEILMREKAAFSDAVGHSMVDDLKAYAESRYSDKEFEAKRQQYTYAPPFTKESLLYREIFERYYPGQSDMIADFWMPNRSWPGCNVGDPSARVLSNYGDSGK